MMPRLFKAILLGFLVGIVGLVVSLFHFALKFEENTGLGLLFKLRGVKQATSDVVIVSIDKQSSQVLNLHNNPDKWPRSLHARLTENLVREGAEVIAFDVHFIEPRSAKDDNLFAESIRKARNVVLAEPLVANEIPLSGSGGSQTAAHSIVKVLKPIELFSRSAAATAPFPLPRIPFKVNRYWTFQTGAGDSPTLPVVAFQLFTLQVYEEFIHLLEKVSPNQAGKLARDIHTAIKTRDVTKLIGDIRAIFASEPLIAERMLDELKNSEPRPVDVKRDRLLESLIRMYGGASSPFINYYGPPRTITTIPYHQALKLREGVVDGQKLDLKGKTVFVGLSEILLADRKDSFYTVFSQANGIFISGVEIAATAFSNILADTPVKLVSLPFHFLLILLWGILVGIVCRISNLKVGALGVVGVSILYLVVAEYQFKANNTWYPIVIPLFFQTPLAFLGAVAIEHGRLFKEALDKLRVEKELDASLERIQILENIKSNLAKFVPQTVQNLIEESPEAPLLDKRAADVSVLFADLTGYTRLSEQMEQERLNKIVERYFGAFLDEILKQGGDVNETAGDGIMVIFQNSDPRRHASSAVRAALEIQRRTREINGEMQGQLSPIGVHVGINSGVASVGATKIEGTAGTRWTYTASGSTTNVAARLSALVQGEGVILSQETRSRIGDEFSLDDLGPQSLKNVSKPVRVYRLITK